MKTNRLHELGKSTCWSKQLAGCYHNITVFLCLVFFCLCVSLSSAFVSFFASLMLTLEVVFRTGKTSTCSNFKENSVSNCFCPPLLPLAAHQQLRNGFNRDGRGDGNQSGSLKANTSRHGNTCVGLLVPWEKTQLWRIAALFVWCTHHRQQ